MRLPARQHAPALSERLVDVVDLERNRVVAMRSDHGARRRPEDDGATKHDEVNRQHHRARGRAERDPPDAARLQQPTAFSGEELRDNRGGRQCSLPGRRLRAGAEQRGRCRPQGGGELAQREGVRHRREVLQVFQVPQGDLGTGRYLHSAQLQFRAAQRYPPAQVAGIGWRRPSLVGRHLQPSRGYVSHGHQVRGARGLVCGQARKRRFTSSAYSAVCGAATPHCRASRAGISSARAEGPLF